MTTVAGLTNWAGNHAYVAGRIHSPDSMERLQEIVRGSRSLRVLGSRHAFNDIADTTGDLVSLGRMPRRFELDPVARTVTVDGGVRYGEIAPRLDEAGFALHNLASLPHISVAGACATATHGSGDANGNLATAVTAMEVVTASGELARFARDGEADVFHGTAVSLGGLGVVTSITLAVEPTYRMRQDVYEDLPLSTALERFDAITASGDSVSLFTTWRAASFDMVWVKRRTTGVDDGDAAPSLFGATRATEPRHPIPGIPADACTAQLGVAGPWFERLPHFRLDHTPSAGAELQSEYLLPRRHAPDALLAIDRIRDRIAPSLFISEIRTVAADDLWMSPSYERASAAIHFTWRPDWPAVREVLPVIEAALAPFEPRPHWGKLFTMPPEEVRHAYPRLPEFRGLLERHDPTGTFRNAFLDRYIV